jgi:hypothetical protein
MKDDHCHAGISPLAELWGGLRAHLAHRFRELNAEIRRYPTPIARCDDQLPKLIEQRDHVRAELERMAAIEAGPAAPAAPPCEEVAGFLGAAAPSDDDTELELRARLEAELAAARGFRK